MLPDASDAVAVIVYKRPLPPPLRSARSSTSKVPSPLFMICQSAVVLPSPPLTVSLLVTDTTSVGEGSQASTAEIPLATSCMA